MELLVVIAVIGILAAIALPALTGVFNTSTNAKAHRNAQMICSVYSTARAAGASIQGATIPAITNSLVTGVAGRTPFADTKFALSPLSPKEIGLAAQFLTYEQTTGGIVHYNAANVLHDVDETGAIITPLVVVQ